MSQHSHSYSDILRQLRSFSGASERHQMGNTTLGIKWIFPQIQAKFHIVCFFKFLKLNWQFNKNIPNKDRDISSVLDRNLSNKYVIQTNLPIKISKDAKHLLKRQLFSQNSLWIQSQLLLNCQTPFLLKCLLNVVVQNYLVMRDLTFFYQIYNKAN